MTDDRNNSKSKREEGKMRINRRHINFSDMRKSDMIDSRLPQSRGLVPRVGRGIPGESHNLCERFKRTGSFGTARS